MMAMRTSSELPMSHASCPPSRLHVDHAYALAMSSSLPLLETTCVEENGDKKVQAHGEAHLVLHAAEDLQSLLPLPKLPVHVNERVVGHLQVQQEPSA